MYEDKSYDWILKGPPSSWYIKQAAGLSRGADRPGHETVASISLKHLYEIAQVCVAEWRHFHVGAGCAGGGVRHVLLPLTLLLLPWHPTKHAHTGTNHFAPTHARPQVKSPDMPGMSLRGVVKCLMSQCQSMGIRVVERPEDA